MSYPIQKQREDLEGACRMLESKIEEMHHQKEVLTNALNAIDQGENILESGSIVAQAAREIMYKLMLIK